MVKKTLWTTSFQSAKLVAGEQVLPLGCRAMSHVGGVVFYRLLDHWPKLGNTFQILCDIGLHASRDHPPTHLGFAHYSR